MPKANGNRLSAQLLPENRFAVYPNNTMIAITPENIRLNASRPISNSVFLSLPLTGWADNAGLAGALRGLRGFFGAGLVSVLGFGEGERRVRALGVLVTSCTGASIGTLGTGRFLVRGVLGVFMAGAR